MAYFGKILRNYSDVAFDTTSAYGSFLSSVPRQKFTFAVEFIPSHHDTSDRKAWNTLFKDLSLVVQSVELPSYQFDVQTLNQYNRKRIVQTRVNWNPISMSLLDTRDNKFQDVLTAYFEWYYREGRQEQFNFGLGSQVPDIVTASNRVHDFGFQPPMSKYSANQGKNLEPNKTEAGSLTTSTSAATDQSDYDFKTYDKYFFSKIVIHRYVGGHYGAQTDPIEIFNPTIVSVSHDTLNYADSSPIQWQVTFAYEGVNYRDTLGDNDSRMNSLWNSAKKTAGNIFGSSGSQSNVPNSEPVNKDGSPFGFNPSA